MEKPPVVIEPKVSKYKDKYLRWVSSRHANRYRLGKLGDAKVLLLDHTVVSNDNNLAYIKNSKAGCTTVTAAIYRYNYGHWPSDNVHQDETRLYQGRHCVERNLRAIESSATTFSFVRNPAERIKSAFVNFFIDEKNRSLPQHRAAIERWGIFDKDDPSYRFDVFLDYVEESLAISPERTDRHWRPQSLNVGIGMLQLSYLGKLEDGLEKGLAEVAQLSGCTELSMPPSRLNTSSKVNFLPNALQSAKIERLYAEDYENFGY